MKKMSVRAQLAIAFGGMTLLLIAVTALSVFSFQREYDEFESYVNGARARAETAHLVREAIDLRAVAARNLVLVTRPEDRELEKNIVHKAHAAVGANMQELKKLSLQSSASEEIRRLIDKIDTIENAYAPVALGIVDMALQGKQEQAIAKMNDECRPLLAALVAASGEYAKITVAQSAIFIEEAGIDYARTRNKLIAASLAAVALALVAGTLIARNLLQALGAEPLVLCDAVSRVASGDLTGQFKLAPNDKSSVMAAVNRMQLSLTEVVTSVRRDSELVSTAATEISSGNNDLSARTEQQAGALEETASSIEELTATVRQNADNTRQANVLAATASDVAVKGGAVVAQVVETMGSISEASNRIVEIISVIDGIAFQTNILALNAAVEAARAGEQGRGFAVVASEVRNLAQRSAGAAKEIKTLIDSSVERVDAGARLAAEAGATMSDVVSSVQRVNDIIGEISTASREQSAGIEQINNAITDMDSMTQQNAALVEEAAAAAESLRSQAEHLVQSVGTFKTEQAQPGRVASARRSARLALPGPAPIPTY